MCPFGKLMCMTKKNKTMKIKQLSYLLLGAVLCGCTTDTTEEAGTKKTDADFIVRATVGDDGQTRADMTEDGLRFSFSAEDADRIGLYLNYPANDWTDQNLCFEAVNSQTKGWVDFKQVSSSTFAIQEGLNVYAYYPYEENEAQVSGTTDGAADSRAAVSSNWAGTRNLEVPAEQQQVAGDNFSNLAKYYALAAVPTTVVNDTDNTPTVKLSFSGIFALLRIRLVNDTDNDVTIDRVDFEAARNQPLTGLYTADLTANPQFGNTDYKTTAVAGRTDNKVSVTLTTPATIAAGGDSYVYAVVHPLQVSYCVITAWTTDGYKFVERKTFNDNTTVSLQRDIRRTFRCPMSESNKLPVNAPSQDAEGYYEIDSYEDMLWVSENATDAAKKYKMTQDIDMTGKIYTPIGFGTNYTEGAKAQEFAGEFDGGGHTISNVTVNPSYHTCVGIFGATKSGAVIKNLKVANLTYESDLPSEKAGQRKWIGGLIGYALPGTTVSDVALTNISLTANGSKESASTSYRIGGVIGLMELGSAEVSLYKNITADGVTLTGGYALGGFAGTMQQNARIEECSVKNVTIRHKNQILYGETSYPATGGYVYASSYFAGDVNQGTIDITCSGELVGGTNSREDLDGLGSMYESTWDIQPYVGELGISTLTLNGEALSRKVEVATPEELAATLASRGGEIAVTADLDLTTAQAVQVNYPTVLTLGQGTKITVSSNKLNNYSDLTVSGPGSITGDYGLIRNYAGANLTIDGGATLETTNNQQGSGILNNGGKVVLEDCTVNAAFYAVANQGGGSLTVNNGKFSSTAHNGNGQWAYCIRTLGEGTQTVINYAEVSGVQGAVAVDSGGKVTINDGIFSTYDLSGMGNNFHGLAVLADGHAVVNGGKFYSEGHDYCVRLGDDGAAAASDPSTVELKGGYFGDMGLDKIKGGTTITPAAGYKFEQLAEPIVEQSTTVPGKTNTYKYRIVAQ